MKVFNLIILNLNVVKSKFAEDSLFDLESSYQFTNDPSDLFIYENIETHNQNSAQTPNHDQFIDDTMISHPIIQNNIASDFNPINSDPSSKRMRIHYNNSPSSYISSTPSHFPIEPIHAQETQSSTSTHHSSRCDEFNSNLNKKISSTATKFVSNFQHHPKIPFNHQTFQNQKLKIPSLPINSNIVIKSPEEQSEPKQQNIESSTSRSFKPHPASGQNSLYNWLNVEPKEIDEIGVLKSINSLKLLDGTKFFNISPFNDKSKYSTKIHESKLNHRIFCLNTSYVQASKKFFSSYWDNYLRVTMQNKNDMKKIATKRKKSTWDKFLICSHKSGSVAKEISDYKEFVLLEFDEKIQETQQFFWKDSEIEIKNEKNEKNVETPSGETQSDLEAAKLHEGLGEELTSRQIKSHFRDLSRAMLLFPFFLVHVDLINTILPVENFDKLGNTLRTQRKIAGDDYLTLVKYLINDKYKIVHPEQIPIGQIGKLTYNTSGTLFSLGFRSRTDFVWQAIYYWMVNSRPEILNIAIDENSISNPFKSFFAHSIECWFLSAE